MTNEYIGKPEKVTQKRVIKFFQDVLGYTYIGDLTHKVNKNVDVDKLKKWLTSQNKYSETVIKKAITKFVDNTYIKHSLYDSNAEVYTNLRYSVKSIDDEQGNKKDVQLIDFDNIGNNIFEIAEEVTVKLEQEKRPDLVVYVNGIAIAVIELKKSSVSIYNGVRQNITNQKDKFIEQFFTTIQFCMAGNDTEGLMYGTIETDAKNYLEWKEDNFKEFPDERDEKDVYIEEKVSTIKNKLEKGLFQMFEKTRFLRLIKDFIIFDQGEKKICRYNQYFGIMRAQKRLAKKKGGIIWHTQGSGKSLTMVWLAKWILSNLDKSRVLIVTDRDELDEQIEGVFKGVNLNSIVRTKSGSDLLKRLNMPDDRLMCSLIHKFGRRGSEATQNDLDKYAEDLLNSLPDGFSAKDNIYVFVDECHRTQSGKLHKAMETILPNAVTIGFTGTPLLKKDKKTSLEIFGSYIHTYKYNEGVADGIVLDLKYEARTVEQKMKSQDKVDAWFGAKTKGLNEKEKQKLKQMWGNMQKVYSSGDRLEQIATDIMLDFAQKDRLCNGSGTAILVADSIYSACRYYNIFQELGLKECAVISSYLPNIGDLRTESVSVDDETTEGYEKYNTYLQMVGIDTSETSNPMQIIKKIEEYEKKVKKQFKKEPNKMKLLIVVNKLLTGFDAPSCTYLYIDKNIEDQNLFQAVCRTNRLDGDSKPFGYIVDYKQLFGELNDAMSKYTSGAFEAFDESDVDGLLKDRKNSAKDYFYEILNELDSMCSDVPYPKEEADYCTYFSGECTETDEEYEIFERCREKMYSLVNKLIRAYAEFKPYFDDFGYSMEEQSKIDKKVGFYTELKITILKYCGEFIDMDKLKNYEPDMRRLIDNYIVAVDSSKLGNIDDFTLLDFINEQKEKFDNPNVSNSTKRNAAEAIENNIRKKIVEKKVINPKYYQDMSIILQGIIEEQKASVEIYKIFLDKYVELAKNVMHPENNPKYPETIRHSEALRTLYDNLGENEELALKIHDTVMEYRLEGFRTDSASIRRIKGALYKVLNNEDLVERVYSFVENLEEY